MKRGAGEGEGRGWFMGSLGPKKVSLPLGKSFVEFMRTFSIGILPMAAKARRIV
jgi:hypothetical protein